MPGPGKECIVQHDTARFASDHIAQIVRQFIIFKGHPDRGNVKISIVNEDVRRAGDQLLEARRQGGKRRGLRLPQLLRRDPVYGHRAGLDVTLRRQHQPVQSAVAARVNDGDIDDLGPVKACRFGIQNQHVSPVQQARPLTHEIGPGRGMILVRVHVAVRVVVGHQ